MNATFDERGMKQTEDALKDLMQKHRHTSWMRLCVFLLFALLVIAGIIEVRPLYFVGACGFLFVFFLLVGRHVKLEGQQKYLGAKKITLQRNLDRYDQGWKKSLDTGQDFLSESFPQGKDLDVFGSNSLFQFLCAAHTTFGRESLAKRLQNRQPQRHDIMKHQNAVKEMAQKRDFALHFSTLGAMLPNTADGREVAKIFADMKSEVLLNKSQWLFQAVMWILPACNVILIIGMLVSFQPLLSALFAANALLSLLFTGICVLRNNKSLRAVELLSTQIDPYVDMLVAVECETFTDPLLCEIQSALTQNGSASAALRKFGSICESAKSRKNPFAFVFLNLLLLWDFHLVNRYVIWRRTYSASVIGWMRTIGQVEMLISLSKLYHVREDICRPHIVRCDSAKLSFVQLKHPLLNRKCAVGNNLSLGAETCIITGSNMSGKTTFLRTVGINALLAFAGAPVLAEKFIISELMLCTSVRTDDDLSAGVSSFYAELLRLKEIVSLRERQTPMLVLIDEIFKGTNSADRVIGASETIKRLAGDQVITLITTHDFAICDLELSQEIRAVNHHFSESYVKDRIVFDYTIREGRCKSTNAQFLLKMVGIL